MAKKSYIAGARNLYSLISYKYITWTLNDKKNMLKEGKRAAPTWQLTVDIAGV